MAETIESSYGFGGCHFKIRDVCMELEPCFEVHNLVIQPNNTKLGQMTTLGVVLHMIVSIYKFATRPSLLLNLKVANNKPLIAIQI